ncbi:vomeronasal type-2 receptor 26-like [Engystomops pustulosus]|uniref:vomeronasal type-2 receptor 26-like n=1 Tax=Engystomops pustulosus TaxID=76066 RepID=UPI003AFAB855
MDSIFNNKIRFPTFFRTVPDDWDQHNAIVLLLKHFGWNWIGIVRADDESSERAVIDLTSVLTRNGICVVLNTIVYKQYTLTKFKSGYEFAVQEILKSNCDVIIFLGNTRNLRDVQMDLLRGYNNRKVFILPPLFTKHSIDVGHKLIGSLQISLSIRDISGLKDFLLNVGPFKHPDSKITYDIWDFYLECCKDPSLFNICRSCNDTNLFSKVHPSMYDVNNFRFTFSVYSAVYAVAYALHDLSLREGDLMSLAKNRSRMLSKVNRYLQTVNFTTPGGEELHFNENRSTPARFDVLNYYILNTTNEIRRVGYYNDVGGDQQFMINDSDIHWDPKFAQTPQSLCNPRCLHGYRKVLHDGKPRCCYYCVPCPEGEISNQTDMETCLKCSRDQWSNERRDSCIPRAVEFLSYEETLGLSLVVLAVVLCLLTAVILGIFIRHKDTAIVKANNQNLSFILLLTLILSSLCPLLFIGHPTETSCLLRQVAFSNIFTVSVSTILVKTITVILAFRATKPDTRLRRWLGRHFSAGLLIIFSSVEVVICVFWLSFSPPFPYQDTTTEIGKILLQCDEGSIVAFYVAIGYEGLLAVLSFAVAFFARKLPDTFNEAQYISFSMLVFCSLWISFILAYLSTKGKYMVAVEVLTIEVSSAGLLVCIFIPKCYIILLRPELNVKGNLIIKKKPQDYNIIHTTMH